MQKKEKSCGAVVYRDENGGRLYLLLHYAGGHWDLPKGHVEGGETEEATARREILEETGISELEFAPLFRETITYMFGRDGETTPKEVVFFLAKAAQKEIVLSDEHTGFLWLPFKQACAKVTYKNAKGILEKAEAFLSAKSE